MFTSDGSETLELVAPTAQLYSAWLDARTEWGPGAHEDGFGLLPDDDVASPAGFVAWVGRLVDASAEHADFRCTYRWIVEGDRVLGGIALRYGDGEFVQRVGHIGYGIRPSARRRGVATWALSQIIAQARVLGMNRVLMVCDAENLGSATTIERCGGVLERIEDTELGAARRYWITVGWSPEPVAQSA
ncbi:GNAT family N-acetyltransferase [Nocardia sp. NPDC058705]|uniref:GNAT family N-acetyltransferase n=1 Tax=Nocardia sp. NPDC058705 TaxID=3346609 RepID=UPI003684D0F7